MINIEFTPEECEALNYERYHYPHPKIQKRMEALYLKSQKVRHGEICRLTGISTTTLSTYLKAYRDGGIESLKRLEYKGQSSELNDHVESIEEYFRAHPPRSRAEAQDAIEKLTGIRRSPAQIAAFMKRMGMKIRKTGFIPGKVNDEDKQKEQDEFVKNKLQPRLEEAANGKRRVFFVDAAHFVHGVFLGYVWCFVRVFIPSPSGRKRFNVLGALDAVTKELITVTNEAYINSETVCMLLLKIAEAVGHGPITIVLDNARYQKCAVVMRYAEILGIELLYLPAYSPNLNLIERFWKFVKKECLYSKYYENFGLFKSAISTFINTVHLKHKKELDSLLTWNFQSFSKVGVLVGS